MKLLQLQLAEPDSLFLRRWVDGWLDGWMAWIWLWNSSLLLPAVLIVVMVKKLALSSVETFVHINVFLNNGSCRS